MTQQLGSAGNAICSEAAPAGSLQGPRTADEVLKALPHDASQALRDALQATCCIHYTVSEGDCVAGGCGTGKCCYHVVSTNCGIDEYVCLDYPCDTGNFSTGC